MLNATSCATASKINIKFIKIIKKVSFLISGIFIGRGQRKTQFRLENNIIHFISHRLHSVPPLSFLLKRGIHDHPSLN